MATWTDTAAIKAGITTGKPIIGTGGFGDQTADNLQYLKDAFDTVGVPSDQAIHDDFAGTAVSIDAAGDVGGNWVNLLSGAAALPAITTTDHYVTMDAGGGGLGDTNILHGGRTKIRARLSVAQSLRMIFRWKMVTASARFLIGWQDVGGLAWDTSDFIGIKIGTAATKTAFICMKGGAGTTSADVGVDTAWQVAQIDILQTGSALTVDFSLDGSAVGTTITTNIPNTVDLVPFMLASGDGAARGAYKVDRFDCFYRALPLAP